jgi:uncharacterized protein (TIGR03905 family)
MNYKYATVGTCSRAIDVTLDDDGRIVDVVFTGGCNGNLQGIAAIVRGQKATDVISRLKGIKCGSKPTSCPDQLAQALTDALNAR